MFRRTPVVGPAQHVTLHPSTEPQIAAASEIRAMTASKAHIIPTCTPEPHRANQTAANSKHLAKSKIKKTKVYLI